MKIRIISEEFPYPKGLEVDWPALPRKGDIVCFHHRGGTSNLAVEEVRWQVETDGKPIEVEVHLTF